jgi:hypothetical protein
MCHATAVLVLACVAVANAATPWPYPSKISVGTGVLSLRSFNFTVVGDSALLLARAAELTDAIRGANGDGCSKATPPAGTPLASCSVKATDETAELAQDVDESYKLDVSADGCTITAPTVSAYACYEVHAPRSCPCNRTHTPTAADCPNCAHLPA